ncbi:hypothetical protein OAN83_00095 [Alphaproteobacteria bacterium]|nr:hypothetical protein [Alphaproteobacteria bacterium]
MYKNLSPTLVAASASGKLTIYGWLSAFLTDMVALRRGQHVDPDRVQRCDEFCQHQLRRGETVAIVLKRHRLPAACDDCNTDIIMSLTAPLYTC